MHSIPTKDLQVRCAPIGALFLLNEHRPLCAEVAQNKYVLTYPPMYGTFTAGKASSCRLTFCGNWLWLRDQERLHEP
jgi:hypothetical protein